MTTFKVSFCNGRDDGEDFTKTYTVTGKFQGLVNHLSSIGTGINEYTECHGCYYLTGKDIDYDMLLENPNLEYIEEHDEHGYIVAEEID